MFNDKAFEDLPAFFSAPYEKGKNYIFMLSSSANNENAKKLKIENFQQVGNK